MSAREHLPRERHTFPRVTAKHLREDHDWSKEDLATYRTLEARAHVHGRWHDMNAREHFLEAHSPGGDVGESTLHEGHVDVDDPEDVAAAHAHDHDPAEWYGEEHARAPYVSHDHNEEA